VGLTAIFEATPVPVNGIIIGSSGTNDCIVTAALFDPVDSGLKTTSNTRLSEGGMFCPEAMLFMIENSLASVPVKVIVSTKRSAVPVLKIVKVWETEEVNS
jgi:hypothetical protein